MAISYPLSAKKHIYAGVIAISILATGFFLLHMAASPKKDVIATAFLADIVLTFPAVYFFLVLRPLKLKKRRMLLVFTCCCAVAYLLLPAHQQHYIVQLRKLTIAVELGIVIYGLSKISRIRRTYATLQSQFPDIAYNVSRSLSEILGNGIAIRFLASELTVLYFGLFWWKKHRLPSMAKPGTYFTVHKESGYTAFFGVLLVACLVELVALHLLLTHYSKTAADILSALSVYGILFIVGDFSAIAKSPVMIFETQLLLRTGLRWRALVSKTDVLSIEKIKESYVPDENCFKGGPMKNSSNVLITFKHPIRIERLYRKAVFKNRLVMYIDDVDDFIIV